MAHPPIDSQITFLYTDDLAQTAQFYEEVMGLQLKLDQGACRIYQVSGDGYLGFCRRSAASSSSQEPTHVILTIVTSDVDGWHRHLLEHDVLAEKPPTINPEFNIYHCFLRDPNGYLLEIQQFLHEF